LESTALIKAESSTAGETLCCLSYCKTIEKNLFMEGRGSINKIWDFTMPKPSFKPVRKRMA